MVHWFILLPNLFPHCTPSNSSRKLFSLLSNPLASKGPSPAGLFSPCVKIHGPSYFQFEYACLRLVPSNFFISFVRHFFPRRNPFFRSLRCKALCLSFFPICHPFSYVPCFSFFLLGIFSFFSFSVLYPPA